MSHSPEKAKTYKVKHYKRNEVSKWNTENLQ